jgi:hypothetical protein
MITRIHWGSVGCCRWHDQIGRLFAVWPEPVDHDACFQAAGFGRFDDTGASWDSEFRRILDGALGTLASYGAPDLGGPEAAGSASLLDRLLRRTRPAPSLRERVEIAATDDNLPCWLEHGAPPRALLLVSDGHPILWIWLATEVADDWPRHLAALAAPTETVETTLTWEHLVPDTFHIPQLAAKDRA